MNLAKSRLTFVLVAALAMCGACSSRPTTDAPPQPQGPAMAQLEVVDEHADQFDDTIGDRPAGSQSEFAAATYILAHLQTAGYTPLLHPVPVEDAVRSTNVVAPPPSGVEPIIVVTVAYDTAPGAASTGHDIGLWLELARALNAREQEHDVEFVALGAERAQLNDGNLGARRLVEFLRGDELAPLVIELTSISPEGASVVVSGSDADEIVSAGVSVGVSARASSRRTAQGLVLGRAGMSHIAVSGGANDVAEVLLEYLADGRS